MHIDHPHILDILYSYNYVSNEGKIVNFCWIPSHSGINENKVAYTVAKSAFDFEIVKFKFPKLYVNSGRYFGGFFCDSSKINSTNKVNKAYNSHFLLQVQGHQPLLKCFVTVWC